MFWNWSTNNPPNNGILPDLSRIIFFGINVCSKFIFCLRLHYSWPSIFKLGKNTIFLEKINLIKKTYCFFYYLVAGCNLELARLLQIADILPFLSEIFYIDYTFGYIWLYICKRMILNSCVKQDSSGYYNTSVLTFSVCVCVCEWKSVSNSNL